MSGGGDSDDPEIAATAAGEVFLQPAASTGPDPFSTDVARLIPPGIDEVALSAGASPVVTGQVTQIVEGVVATTAVGGTTPGLYGGTRDEAACDPEAVIAFLREDEAKGAAWAAAQSITPDEIGVFIRGLTPVVLLNDTRVTNHGFRDGQATAFAAVLQKGTAVLVDATGVPRARCACGNPLLAPEAQAGEVTYTGESWEDFEADEVTVVSPGEPTETLILQDVAGDETFARPVGTGGEQDATVEAAGTETSSPATTAAPSTTAAPATTTTTTTTTTTPPSDPVDVSADGTVSVSSTYSGDFAAGLAVDGSAATSWFSAGGGSATFTWTGQQADWVDEVIIIGNGSHQVEAFRTGFGFESVEIELYLDGQLVARATAGLGGTPDPTVSAQFGVIADEVRLEFSGGEDPTCGGFSELRVVALR